MKLYNEAINIVLQALGEPLLQNTDSIEGIFEAEQADFTIEQVKQEVLAEGWYINTDDEWPLLPDTNGYIAVPSTALKIDASDTGRNIIVKDSKLYDKDKMTYKFTVGTEVKCSVSWNLDFNDLPHSFQRYIALRAARLLSQRLDGDINMIKVLMEDEKVAGFALKREEFDTGDYSIFDNNDVSRIINRNTNPIKGA